MNTKFWRQGNPTSRPVDQATIDRAQAANSMQAGPAMQHGMSQLPHDSDAYRQMQWAVKGAQQDLAARPGVVQRNTDPMANPGLSRLPSDGAPSRYYAPAAASAMDLDRAAVAKLEPGFARFWQDPEQQRSTRQERLDRRTTVPDQARIDAQTPLYRGMAGVGSGSVNGVETLYPVAGHVGEYSAAMGAVGLLGQTGASRQAYEQGRSNLVRGQEAGRRQAKKDATAAGELGHSRALELAGIKAAGGRGGYGKSGDTVTEREQKAGIGAYNKAVVDWRKNLTDGNTLAEMVARARLNDETIIKYKGTEYDIEQADAMADAWTTAPKPSADEYYVKPAAPGATKTGAPVNAPQPGILDRIGGMFRGGGQPAAAPAAGQNPNQRYTNPQYSNPSSWYTQLDPAEEQQFRAWAQKNKVAFDPNDAHSDYDMRGFWQKYRNDPSKTAINPNDHLMHYTDEFKTPLHKSFSRESRYATPDAPKWANDHQLVDSSGNVVFDERQATGGGPPQNRQQARNAYISSLDQSLWKSLDHNEREQFLVSQGL